jgi:DNA-directed RNA polymerase III subunit RPC5
MATGDNDKPPSLDADVDMADLASLDATAATSAAAGGAPSTRFRPKAKGKPRPKAEPPRPVPVAVPKPEPEPEPEAVPVPEPDANPAPPPEDTMEVDGAVDAPGHGEGAVEEDFVLREIDVYFNPKPFEDDTQVMYPRTPSSVRLQHSEESAACSIDAPCLLSLLCLISVVHVIEFG